MVNEMKEMRKGAVIVPVLLEPNGKLEKFSEVARDPKMKKLYEDLLKRHKWHPEEVGKKLREVTWGKKSVDEVAAEL